MKRKTFSLLWFLLVVVAVTRTHAAPAAFSGLCVGLADGDTISVMRNGRAEKIRLHGIDCPESAQPFGTRAKQFAGDLVFQKTVTVYPTDVDRYGRTVAWVFVGKRCLNRELVGAGLAWWYRQYAPSETKLSQLQAQAKAARRGLWADANAVAPWEWRRGKRSPASTSSSPNAVNAVGIPKRAPVIRPTAVPTTRRAPVYRTAPSTQFVPRAVPAPAPQLRTPTANAGITRTVYITKTGAKYHEVGCRHLARSQIPISLQNALNQGYDACKVCH